MVAKTCSYWAMNARNERMAVGLVGGRMLVSVRISESMIRRLWLWISSDGNIIKL